MVQHIKYFSKESGEEIVKAIDNYLASESKSYYIEDIKFKVIGLVFHAFVIFTSYPRFTKNRQRNGKLAPSRPEWES